MRRELVGGPQDGEIVDLNFQLYRFAVMPLFALAFDDGPMDVVDYLIDEYEAYDKYDPGCVEKGRPPAKFYLARYTGRRRR